MLRRFFLTCVTALAFANAGFAQTATETPADSLFIAMGLPEIIDVMQQEGLTYGETIARDMFPSGMSPRWADAVAQVYDTDRMIAEMRAGFAAALQGKDIDQMLAFYNTDLGQRIVMHEIAAREAMLDPALEAASKEMAAEAAMADTRRHQLIVEFITVNDLVEANVVGGLNSNYAFVSGLLSGGGTLPGMTEDTLLDDVWAQEPDIRATTTEWLQAFLMLAYEPLTDDELAELISYTATPVGQDLTRALFAAFDTVFERVSRDLGSAASGFIISQEL